MTHQTTQPIWVGRSQGQGPGRSGPLLPYQAVTPNLGSDPVSVASSLDPRTFLQRVPGSLLPLLSLAQPTDAAIRPDHFSSPLRNSDTLVQTLKQSRTLHATYSVSLRRRQLALRGPRQPFPGLEAPPRHRLSLPSRFSPSPQGTLGPLPLAVGVVGASHRQGLQKVPGTCRLSECLDSTPNCPGQRG